MEEAANKGEIKTFSVPFASREIKENVVINTTHKSRSSKQQIIKQAFAFHSQGKISKAAKYYKQFINQGFEDAIVFSNYGVIMKDLGKLKEAKLLLQKAIEVKPDFASAYSNLGLVLKELGKVEKAEICLQKSVTLEPDDGNTHFNLGIILKELNKLQEAELSLRRVIKLKPDFATAYSNLGTILSNLGKSQEAELSYREAIKIQPDYAEAYYNLGNILRDHGKLKEAELCYRKAIEIKPDYAEGYANLGSILEELGQLEEAIKYLEKAVKFGPEKEIAFISLAHRLCYEKKYELALKYLSQNKSNSCQILYLGCLLSLDREQEFNEKFEDLSKKRVCNANIGGIVEHANIIYKKKYDSPFCNEAIKYILIDKINEESFSQNHLNELISYTQNSKTRIRAQGILKGGVQTSGNLFSLDFPFVNSIKKALEEKIELYKNKFKDSGQGFIKNWPVDYELRSWMINMKSGGFLAPHNHEYGWITGSFYLHLPKHSNSKNGGNLAFSYQGPRYPKKEKDFNLTIQKIETRDICIFPSSLFHHTIPFKSSEERICFVFDLIQKCES
ncbi:hypothetical protein DNJ72_00245 [Prochlorococcus marinus XMU1403]|uniref:tetratricopeptide repeat protein n=1 Tax=Prochlorococcus marinus TaxID=1219 RepID=UPI000D8EFBCD|nr:tetratricopeptide repeat protein [Prochlorococcus marinus]MBW3048499.1 hypothetical protein [Prochlorococcus marinus str. MU1403]PYE03940.1 hypothetical protein DNJ72_00245 [Prochlorococcus marinus XMU1403]